MNWVESMIHTGNICCTYVPAGTLSIITDCLVIIAIMCDQKINFPLNKQINAASISEGGEMLKRERV